MRSEAEPKFLLFLPLSLFLSLSLSLSFCSNNPVTMITRGLSKQWPRQVSLLRELKDAKTVGSVNKRCGNCTVCQFRRGFLPRENRDPGSLQCLHLNFPCLASSARRHWTSTDSKRPRRWKGRLGSLQPFYKNHHTSNYQSGGFCQKVAYVL